MTGTCAVANVYYDGKHSQPYDLINSLSVSHITQSDIAINPLIIFPTDSQESNMASGYTRFRFTSLISRYTSLSPSSAKGSIAQMFYPDVVESESTFNFDKIISSPDSASWPLWMSGLSQSFDHRLNRTWYYVDVISDDITFGTARQNFQGTLVGAFGNVPSDEFGLYGTVYFSYTLELVEPRLAIDQSPTTSVISFGLPQIADPPPGPVPALGRIAKLSSGVLVPAVGESLAASLLRQPKLIDHFLSGSTGFRAYRLRHLFRQFQSGRKHIAAPERKVEIGERDIDADSRMEWKAPPEDLRGPSPMDVSDDEPSVWPSGPIGYADRKSVV